MRKFYFIFFKSVVYFFENYLNERLGLFFFTPLIYLSFPMSNMFPSLLKFETFDICVGHWTNVLPTLLFLFAIHFVAHLI